MNIALRLFAYPISLGLATGGALASPSTEYTLQEQQIMQQTGSSSTDFASGYALQGAEGYAFDAFINTDGASLSAAPVLGLPAPSLYFGGSSITFPTGPDHSPSSPTGNGYNQYKQGNHDFASTTALNSAYGSGAFTFTMGDASVSPQLTLDTASPTFPITPMLTGGGTWSGDELLLNPNVKNVLTFNTSSFSSYGAGLGESVKFEFVDSNLNPILPPDQSQYLPAAGLYQPELTSYTIAAGTLQPGKLYSLQAAFAEATQVDSASITGTGIFGDPLGFSIFNSATFITVETTPEPATTALLVMGGVAFPTATWRRRNKSLR